MTSQNPLIKIFIAYARTDKGYLLELKKYLKPLNRKKTIQIWYDGEILGGEEWAEVIRQQLHAADIILLLISANSLNSDFFYNEEMQKALERHKKGEAKVIPVILRHCTWHFFEELSELQVLPKDGIPLSSWKDESEAYTNVVKELSRILASIRPTKALTITQKQQKNVEFPEPIQELLQNMVRVEGGIFQMGSNRFDEEEPIHLVTVESFEIAKYPITQAQWQAVMGIKFSKFKGCNICPVESVSWNDSKKFIQFLNKLTDKQFRLPSEAEWEFAARGGNKSRNYRFAGSDSSKEVAWYWKNANKKTHPIGKKKPNELGLYDMSGNVWEWCEDDWHKNYRNALKNSSPWINEPRKKRRVVRGGSWAFTNEVCTVTSRSDYKATDRFRSIGFRLALS